MLNNLSKNLESSCMHERGAQNDVQEQFIVPSPNDFNQSNSFSFSLIADFINSVTELKPCFPMAFFSISSVNDLGIFRDMYSFSAIYTPNSYINICTLWGLFERYKAKDINNKDYIPTITLSYGGNERKLQMNEGDVMNERKKN